MPHHVSSAALALCAFASAATLAQERSLPRSLSPAREILVQVRASGAAVLAEHGPVCAGCISESDVWLARVPTS
jgi:hypothetical protein